MEKYENMEYRQYTKRSELDKALHTLEGLLEGVLIDNEINQTELKEIRNWCDHHRGFKNKQPFKEILPLIQGALTGKVFDVEEIRDIIWVCRKFKESIFYDVVTSDIQKLHGILHGILSDNVITDDEVIGLNEWLIENNHLEKTYPYDELCSILAHVLADGVIDDAERDLLKVFFSEFIDINNSETINSDEICNLKKHITINGICSMTPEILFQDKVFCFTGVSARGSRKSIADTIESLGGMYKDTVVKSTNYLIVGDDGNPCWCFSCYGRKVEKAMELRKKGADILIVHENDFWDALEDLKL